MTFKKYDIGKLSKKLELIDKKEKMKILEREQKDKELFYAVKYDGTEYKRRLEIIADFGEDKKED